jgi:hypothetical protein
MNEDAEAPDTGLRTPCTHQQISPGQTTDRHPTKYPERRFPRRDLCASIVCAMEQEYGRLRRPRRLRRQRTNAAATHSAPAHLRTNGPGPSRSRRSNRRRGYRKGLRRSAQNQREEGLPRRDTVFEVHACQPPRIGVVAKSLIIEVDECHPAITSLYIMRSVLAMFYLTHHGTPEGRSA